MAEQMRIGDTADGVEFTFSEPREARGTMPLVHDGDAFDAALAQDALDRKASGLSRAEWAEYGKLKRSGQYTDDQTMRLRAMLNAGERSRDDVARMAWSLRRHRDAMLAERSAREHGGTASDYLVPTQLHQIGVAKGDYLPAHLDPKEEAARFFDSQVAFDRDSGDPARALAAKRRARYLAARWGLQLEEDMEPVGRWVPEPVRASSDGWVWTSGNRRFRVGPGGTMDVEGYERRRGKGDERYSYAQADTGYRPTRPGEPLRREDGSVVTRPVPGYRATGSWRLTAPRKKDSAFKRWLRENGKK